MPIIDIIRKIKKSFLNNWRKKEIILKNQNNANIINESNKLPTREFFDEALQPQLI